MMSPCIQFFSSPYSACLLFYGGYDTFNQKFVYSHNKWTDAEINCKQWKIIHLKEIKFRNFYSIW